MASQSPSFRHLTTVTLRLRDHGEEWRFHFENAFTVAFPQLHIPSISISPAHDDIPWVVGDAGKPWIKFEITDDAESLKITLAALQGDADSLDFVILGRDQDDTDLVQGLTAVVNQSVAEVGSKQRTISWTAVLGPSLEDNLLYNLSLRSGTSLGGMTLEPATHPLRESWPDPSSFSSGGTRVSVPILVAGKGQGYGWPEVSMKAARDLRTLCGLLSLAFDVTVAVRESAAEISWGVRTPPEYTDWTPPDVRVLIAQQHETGEPASLPAWLGPAWEQISKKAALRGALDAYLEGRYVEARHPSLSAVCFTACIEVLSEKLAIKKKCSHCDTISGIAAAYRDALRLVLPETEAANLDKLYGSRSRTVHAGRFYGEEVFPGVAQFDLWSGTTPGDFRRRKLWQIRKAAGLLLRRELADETV